MNVGTFDSEETTDRRGWARRADVSLRARYPNLVTRIFEATPDHFVITFDKSLQDASQIDVDEFRPITLPLKLSNQIPDAFVCEIEPLSDTHLARNFEGFPFNRVQLLNLIAGRFPDLPIVNVRDGGSPMAIYVELSESVEPDVERQLLTFCKGLRAPAPFEVLVAEKLVADVENAAPRRLPPDDALFLGASRIRRGIPSFVRADETFWFDNLDQVFEGRLPVERIPGIEEGQSRCFVDATIGNHINLRQLLTLYDTVYLSPPLREEFGKFLQNQALVEEDLLKLIGAGRLKIISTQAEERLNTQFLERAAERSAFAIIGRRTTAAMLIADIVETSDEYRLSDPKLRAPLGEFSRILSQKSGLPADTILQFLLWPIYARRSAVLPLLERGTKGIPPIGMGPFFADFIKKVGERDLEFESLIISEKVHIGHALRATVFPADHEEGLQRLGNAMGDVLNFFRSFNIRIAAAWVGNVERKQAGKLILPPLALLEFDRDIPIEEILAATDRQVMRNRGRALFSRIAEMPEAERAAEIRDLNAALRKYAKPKGILSLDTADTGISLASAALDFVFPPIAGLRTLGKQLLELGRRNPGVDKLMEEIQADIFPSGESRRELDFLSKISRVASLKTTRVS